MIYVFLATGFEEVEALGPIDVCLRAGPKVKTVSVTDEQVVKGAHGIGIVADSMFAENDYSDAEMLFLPGGLPGATNLDAHEGLRRVVLAHSEAGKALAAICAAPLVYGNLGLADGKKMTCYPGFEKYLVGAEYTAALVERDGLMFTGKGPAAALALGYVIVEHFCGEEVAEGLKQGMMYGDL
jgi:4-methyl-5(b-hydroxyethyl)-thiazole monophosphate biosynthesis